MTLSLSKKFFNETNYLLNGYNLSFNSAKNKLTFYKAEKADNYILNLEQIVERVNGLPKPTFSEITSYRNCHKKLKAINQLIDPKKEYIDLASFNENFKPTSAELKEQIWAVHATNMLPREGILKPAVGSCFSEATSEAISNTLHFSLGELVRSHSGLMSWEDKSFAIITPLSSIFDQMINIFAHDTIVNGNWSLKKETIVLVPEEKDISEVQDKSFRVVSYNNSEKKLREAIDEIIREKGGLNLKMSENSAYLGSNALLDETININTPSFFESLFKEKKTLSFGDHSHSQLGDCGRLGILRELSGHLFSMDCQDFADSSNQSKAYVYYHVINYFYEKIKDKYFSIEEQKKYEEKLSECKIAISAFQDIQSSLWPILHPNYLHSMNQKELQKFQKLHPELFDGLLSQFTTIWAVSRWLVIGERAGKEENLDNIININLIKHIEDSSRGLLGFSEQIFGLLKLHSQKYSDRAKTVELILNLDSFKKYKKVLEDSLQNMFQSDEQFYVNSQIRVTMKIFDLALLFSTENATDVEQVQERKHEYQNACIKEYINYF